MTKKPYQVLAWIATGCIITSAALASFNIYPLYLIGFIIGSAIWTVVGILWKENSLITVNATVLIIYLIGGVFSL